MACEVIKLAPIDPGDAPALTAEEFELTPASLVDCVVTEEGTVSPDEIGALVDRTPFLREGYALFGRAIRRPRRQSRHGLHVRRKRTPWFLREGYGCYAASTDCGASCSCGRRTLRETPSAATAPAATTPAPT